MLVTDVFKARPVRRSATIINLKTSSSHFEIELLKTKSTRSILMDLYNGHFTNWLNRNPCEDHRLSFALFDKIGQKSKN